MSRIAASYGNSIINFLRNCQTAYHVDESFYIPMSNVDGFQFLYILIINQLLKFTK